MELARSAALLVACALGLCGSAKAQSSDPAVEDAKGVVADALPNSQYFSAAYYEKMEKLDEQDKRISWTVHYPTITRSTSSSMCVDHIWVGPMTLDMSFRASSRSGIVLLNASDFDLPWGELISVRPDGKDVKLLWKGNSSESAIHYGDNRSAVIVADAITTLRDACAPKQ